MYETLNLDITDTIATLTFNRPQAMNTFNAQMADELERATEQLLLNDQVRVVVLNGNGPLFMAGGDISFFHQGLAEMPNRVYSLVRQTNASILNLYRMNKPVLASVHGSVAGIGISFALVADLVVAAEDTQFTLAYSKIGLTPDGGSSYLLPRTVGHKRAMELLLFADRFSATQAEQWGLVNWVVPSEQLKKVTQQRAKRLAQGPTQTYKRSKLLVQNAWENDFAAHLEAEATAFVRSSATQDFCTGVNAFVSKQPPQFTGC